MGGTGRSIQPGTKGADSQGGKIVYNHNHTKPMAQEKVKCPDCDGHCCPVDGCCEQRGECPEHDEKKPPYPWQSWREWHEFQEEKKKYNVGEGISNGIK